MSEYAFAVERAHRAHAAVSELETALERAPGNRSLRLNLLGMQKMAAQAEAYLVAIANESHVEICRYRLLPERAEKFLMYYVSRSMQNYQDFFSQIYDFKKYNRVKENVGVGKEVFDESSLEFGYSFSGSLGMVLLAPTKRGFFEGQLDASIDTLFEVIELKNPSEVRQAASDMGQAVLKRARDWSEANVNGGFAADIRWEKSDGKRLGQVIPIERMERIVNIVDQTEKSDASDVTVEGVLVGGDIKSGTFHFVVPHGADYRGSLHKSFDRSSEMLLGKRYVAKIKQTRTEHFGSGRVDTANQLLHLS